VDARGGAPGTVNTDAVRLGYEGAEMQAVVFSGGSWYGLSAATGVANAIKQERAAAGDHDFIAGVIAAIIYDVGDRRFSR
jgi:L-aminopeptidase/D-esterase-like protein